jgi:serine phosphatase RsbU (regulator of sigma subunit)
MVKRLDCRPVLPLGMDVGEARPPPVVCHEQLQPGDRVLLYTDGVIEARSPDGEFFGERRLVDLVARNLAGGLPTAETMRRVILALLAHQRGRLDDDATMLLLEWHGADDTR